jgi:hypothetical protein
MPILEKKRNKIDNCTTKLCNISCNNQNWVKIKTSIQMAIEIVTLFDE